MTKIKPPLSEADALGRITTALPGGLEEAATIVGRTTSTVYKWGNPDLDDSTPIGCAVLLERAYRKAGGQGAPYSEYLAAQVALADAEVFAENLEVHRLAVAVNRAAGEANAELAELALPCATDEDWREAERDVSTLYGKLTTLLALLRRGPAKPIQQPP